MTATAFDIEGRRFEVRRLDVDSACRGLELLGKILGSAALEVFALREGGAAPNYALLRFREVISCILRPGRFRHRGSNLRWFGSTPIAWPFT